jgi:hypothetical protein
MRQKIYDYLTKTPARYKSQLDYRKHLSYPLLNALYRLETSIVISTIDEVSHCYCSPNKRELEISASQALALAGEKNISFDMALEIITLHELGHLVMALCKYPQDDSPLTERLAWLLGGKFLDYTGVSKRVYENILSEVA